MRRGPTGWGSSLRISFFLCFTGLFGFSLDSFLLGLVPLKPCQVDGTEFVGFCNVRFVEPLNLCVLAEDIGDQQVEGGALIVKWVTHNIDIDEVGELVQPFEDVHSGDLVGPQI